MRRTFVNGTGLVGRDGRDVRGASERHFVGEAAHREERAGVAEATPALHISGPRDDSELEVLYRPAAQLFELVRREIAL